MTTELREALDAAGAAALVQKKISPVLLEYQRRYSPLLRTIPTEKIGSPMYFFNKRTVLPNGGFVTDGGARPVSSSTYVQENFQIRHFQTVGAVTGYAEEVTSGQVGSLRAREIEGAIKGLQWDVENSLVWAASAPTVAGPYPQFDGLDVICSSFSSAASGGPGTGVGGGGVDNYGGATTWGAPYNPWVDSIDQNAIDAGGKSVSFGLLDQLMDMVENNVAEPVDGSDYFFLMSPAAISRVAQLSLINQRHVDKVEIAPGLIVDSYRNVPLVKTSFLAPRTLQMGAVTAAAGGTGTLNTAYFYKVAPVIARFGEIQASAEATFTAVTQGIKLSFSTPTTAEGLQPTHYKVYRGTATGAETLLGTVDANFYDASGVAWATTNITDNGTTLTAGNTAGGSTQATVPATYVYGNVNLKPLSLGFQNIYLLSRDPGNIVRPYVREMQPKDLYATTSSPDALPFALVSDTTLAVRATKYIGRLANVQAAIDATAGNGTVPTVTGYTPDFVTQ